MSSIYSKNIEISIFGESHGSMMGVTLSNVAPGIKIDFDYINSELERRKGGHLASKRKESDKFEVVSGYFKGYTTGAPLTFIVKNEDVDSSSYERIKDTPRPGHADFAIHEKSLGFNDYLGGGASSGRLTVLLVIVGAFFKSILKNKGIDIYSHISKINDIDDCIDLNEVVSLDKDFPISNKNKEKAINLIENMKNEKDSVGGIISGYILGVEAGIGEPFFDSVEATISSLLFSIPAVKGVAFGKGFAFSELKGSEANDEFIYSNSKVITKTNNNGGINGGITNGMPITLDIAIKPTPSIGIKQETVNLVSKTNEVIEINGRHDPCILLKVPVVIESVLAIAIMDLYIGRYGYLWMK